MRNDVDLFLWDFKQTLSFKDINVDTRDNTDDNKIWINRRVSLVEKENTVYDLENEMSNLDVWGCEHSLGQNNILY